MIFSAVGWSLLLCDFSATARRQKRNKVLVSALRQRKRDAYAQMNGNAHSHRRQQGATT